MRRGRKRLEIRVTEECEEEQKEEEEPRTIHSFIPLLPPDSRKQEKSSGNSDG